MYRKFLHLVLTLLGFLGGHAMTQSPLYTYDFNGNLNEAGAGPTLTLVGAGATGFGTTTLCGGGSNNTFTWAQGRGLRLDATSAISTYSAEIWMNFTTTASYRRVLDYTNLSSDCGLYVVNGSLTFYCLGVTGGTIVQGQNQHLVAVRDGITNQYTVYVNGCQALTFNDAGGAAIIQAANDLIFFKDNGSEESAGNAASIRFYNTALTAAQVSAVYNTFCPPSGGSGAPAVMTYDFSQSTLAEQTMGGPALTELQNAGLQDGFFTTGTPCGTSQVVYEWPTNAGLQYDNTLAGNFVGQNHTVEVFMEFDLLTSWKRILDYSNRTQDLGVYAFNGQIQFYNLGTSPTIPFAANQWAHVLLARRKGITPCFDSTYYDMYVDGLLRLTLTNTGTNSMPSAANVLHFWQDDLAVGNEASSGSASFIRIYNYALNAAQALAAFNDRCDIPLPVDGLWLAGSWSADGPQLEWTALDHQADVTYDLQRSAEGVTFETIGRWAGSNADYQFADLHWPASATTLYYRVVARLPNGDVQPSNTILLHAPQSPVAWLLFPNPASLASASGSVTIQGPGAEAEIHVWDVQGKAMTVQTNFDGNAWQLSFAQPPSAGVYMVEVRSQARRQSFKWVLRP